MDFNCEPENSARSIYYCYIIIVMVHSRSNQIITGYGKYHVDMVVTIHHITQNKADSKEKSNGSKNTCIDTCKSSEKT